MQATTEIYQAMGEMIAEAIWSRYAVTADRHLFLDVMPEAPIELDHANIYFKAYVRAEIETWQENGLYDADWTPQMADIRRVRVISAVAQTQNEDGENRDLEIDQQTLASYIN